MTIPIQREPDELTCGFRGVMEQCCFCWSRTPFWNVKRDVAVCPDCAKTHRVAEIPPKEEWCRQAAERNGRRV